MSQSKDQKIEEVKSNLPVPEQPPKASDFNSLDESTVNVGSGRSTEGNIGTGAGSGAGLRGPATKSSENADMSNIGREGKDGLSGPPKDAAY
ncbi:hypothetical protein K4F52_005449 [Lecanicillium sp. MT-2017a]|nr:hypothetical protein K4F52_005449 [Lecanicillium sp. MT-2017a]